MLWPNGTTEIPPITDGFGTRGGDHRGTDFVGFSTVRAVADGTVDSIVGWRGGWERGGYMVWVQHDGFLSRNLHLVEGSAVVSPGQWVQAGQPLGTMGNTGNSYGVHLHLEIVVNGVQIDPVPFIQQRIEEDMPLSDEDINRIANAVWAQQITTAIGTARPRDLLHQGWERAGKAGDPSLVSEAVWARHVTTPIGTARPRDLLHQGWERAGKAATHSQNLVEGLL